MITSDDGRQPRNRRWALVVVPAAAAGLTALAACGSSGGAATSSPPANPSASASASAAAAAEGLKTATVGNATILTNAKGFTLYSFAPDSATK